MAVTLKQFQQLKNENQELHHRLAQAEMALEAISHSQVDALVDSGDSRNRIYTAEDSGKLYRVMLESMQEGAAALTMDGLILYCNRRLAELLRRPLENVLGAWLNQFLNPTDWMRVCHQLEQGPLKKSLEATLLLGGGERLPVNLTFGIPQAEELSTVVMLVSDLTERKQFEQALRDSEALYRTLVESSEASIAVLDKNGVYLYANTELACRLGRSAEDIAGMKMEDFFPPEVARRQLEKVRGVLDSQQGQVYESISLVGGEPRLYRTSVQPIFGASGRAVLALVHGVDVTEIRLAKEEIAASAARFQNLFENTPVALVELEVTAVQSLVTALRLQGVTQVRPYASQQPEFIAQVLQSIRMQDANQAALKLFAAENKPDYINRWCSIVDQETQEFLLTCLETLFEQRQEPAFETSMLSLAGERKNLLVRLEFEQRDQKYYVLAALTDITERKQAERALQAQAEQIRALAENSPDIIARFDRHHRCLYLNRPLINTPLDHIAAQVGDSLDDIGRPAPEIELRKQKIDQVFQTGLPSQLEFSFPAEGGTLWFDARFVPEFAPDGSVNSVLVISRDITERKKGELVLKKLNRALSMVNECSSALVYAQDEGQLLTDICRLIVETGGYRMAWVGLAEDDPEKSVQPSAIYGFDDGYLLGARTSWADNERGRGPTGTAIREGKLQINHNFVSNPKMAPWREAALKRGYQSSIVLPLKDGNTTFGALTLYSTIPDAFDDDEAGLLSQLADDLAFGMTALRERLANQSLQETARRWEQIFENAKWGVVVSSGDGNFLDLMNPEFASMHGYTVAELTGRPVLDVFAPDYRPELPAMIQRAHETGHHVFETVHLRRNGSTFPAEVDITAVKDENGQVKYRVVNVQDITERKQGEQALLDRETKLSALFSILPVGVSIIDNQRQILESNPALEKILRISADGMARGQHIQRTYLRADGTPMPVEEFPSTIAIREQREVQDVTLGMAIEDGSTVWMNISAAPLAGRGAVLATSDITERRRMEMALQQVNQSLEQRVAERTAALRESERRFRLALKNAPVTVAAQDTDLRFIWAYNQRTQDPASVLGKTDADIFPPETAAVLVPLKRKVLETGQEIREQLWVSSGGRRVFLDLFLEPLRDETDQITGVGLATVDLTEFKLAEEAMRESERRFRLIATQTPDHLSVQDMDLRYITVVNPQLGLTEADMLGKTDYDFLPHDEAKKLTRIKRQVLETGRPMQLVVPVAAREGEQGYFDGVYIPKYDADGHIDGLIGYFRNVTEQKRLEESLRRSQAELEQRVEERTAALEKLNQELKQEVYAREQIEESLQYQADLLENVSEAVYSVDMGFVVRTWNKAAENLYGWTAAETIGQDSRLLLHTQLPASWQDTYHEMSRAECWKGEVIQTRKDGAIIHVDSSVRLLKDASGMPVGMVTIHRPIA